MEKCVFSTCECLDCGHIWRPPDVYRPGICPQCESDAWARNRCEPQEERPNGCYLTKLEESTNNSKDSSVLAEIQEIENQLALKLTVSIEDIRCDVYQAMLVLNDERQRYDKEQSSQGQ